MAKAIKTFIHLPFESDNFKLVWNEWLQYRKEKKLKEYVNTGLKRTFNKLLQLSNNNEATAIKIISNAIENNWEGLHPIKEITTIEQRKKDFFKKLQSFRESNSGLYPKQLYQEFFNYWTKEDSLTNELAFEKVIVFNFKDRLSSWYEKADKEKLSQMWKAETGKFIQLHLEIFKA